MIHVVSGGLQIMSTLIGDIVEKLQLLAGLAFCSEPGGYTDYFAGLYHLEELNFLWKPTGSPSGALHFA